MTLAQLLVDIQIELDEVTHGQSFSTTELTQFANDIYLEWCVYTKCITKIATDNAWWTGPYFDFVATFTDAIGVYTLYNQQTKRYLFDFATRNDMDKIRLDWETWNGTPIYWFPISHTKIGIAPNYFPSPIGLYDITYWASPTILASGDTPLFSSDMHFALVDGTVGRALESVEEFGKASLRNSNFEDLKEGFRKRVASSHNFEMKRIMGAG